MSKPITYHLITVSYGTALAPFIATGTLMQLARDEGDKFPLAQMVLLKNFYIDDLLTGSVTIAAALFLKQQLQNLLQLGDFNLRKWVSLCPEVIDITYVHSFKR